MNVNNVIGVCSISSVQHLKSQKGNEFDIVEFETELSRYPLSVFTPLNVFKVGDQAEMLLDHDRQFKAIVSLRKVVL